MTDRFEGQITDELLERYLDGLLSEEERPRFEQRLANDEAAARQTRLQAQLDSQLRTQYSPPSLTAAQIEQRIAADTDGPQRLRGKGPRPLRIRRLAIAAISAAAIIAVLVISQRPERPDVSPFFEPRQLTLIYRETVEQGFRPYYFCEDADRFAMTFAKRQRTPLRLEPMPSDRRMVGLSYPGGLSRDTTAMLGYADDQPVLVFVDRRDVDVPAMAVPDSEQGLNVHRRELGDLVMYEVSPLPAPKFLEHLRVSTP